MMQPLPRFLPTAIPPDPVLWCALDGWPLLNTSRVAGLASIDLIGEELADLRTVGSAAEVGSSGLRVFSGSLELKAGAYSNTLIAQSVSPAALRQLRHEIEIAARYTRLIAVGGCELPLTGEVIVSRKWRASTRKTLSEITATFEAASAYWLLPPETIALSPGANTVMVEGDGPVHPRLTLTATAAVTDPQFTTDAGTTRVLGSLAPGDTLTVDAMPGVWSVTRNGTDALLSHRGVMPLLERGLRAVTLGPGLTGVLTYRPGVTSPDAQLPLFGPE